MTQNGTAWRKALAFCLALFLAVTNLPAGFLGSAEELLELGSSGGGEVTLGDSGREDTAAIRVELEDGGPPPSGILLALLDADEHPLLEEELDEDGSVRWQLLTDDDSYLIDITLPVRSRYQPGEDWQRVDHNIYRRSVSRRQLTEGELVICLEEPPVEEELPPEPFLVPVAVFEYNGEERVPVSGLRLLFADADSGESLASATSQGEMELGLLLETHSTRLMLIATGLEESHTFADEAWSGGSRVFSLEELKALAGPVEIALTSIEPEWEPLMLHISLDQQVQLSAMRTFAAALTGNPWLTGMVNMNGLTLTLESSTGDIIADATTMAIGNDGLTGVATLVIPMPIEDGDQFVLRLSGLRGSTHEVVTEGWTLSGVDFVRSISGAELKKLDGSGGAVEITLARRNGVKVLTFKSSDGASTVTVETYSYDDVSLSNCLDTETVVIDGSVNSQHDFFFSNEFRYHLSIEAESPDHHWFNSSYNAIDDAFYITYEGITNHDDNTVPDIYNLSIDPMLMETTEFITTYFVTPYLDLVVDKEYLDHEPDGPIWIGLRDAEAHKANAPDFIQWEQGPLEDGSVTFKNVKAYQYTYYLDSRNAYRVTRNQRNFNLMEYLPISTEPQGFRMGQAEENFTPPGGVSLPNYLFYINSDSTVRLTSRPKIVNQEAQIYFDTGDFGADFAGRLVPEVYQGNFAEWTAKKYIVTEDNQLVTNYTVTLDGAREDHDFTVDYQVVFTKRVEPGGDSYRIYFKNISVYFSYDVRAAFGDNKVIGEMRLLRRDAGSNEFVPVQGQVHAIDALLSSGSLGERYGDLEIEGINFVDTNFTYQNMPAYRLEFTGGYLFHSSGNPDESTDLRPIDNLSIDISPASIPPQSSVNVSQDVFDNNLRTIEDMLRNLEDPGHYRFNGLVDGSLLINGSTSIGVLNKTNTGFSFASNMDVSQTTGELVINYTYSYTDTSRENLKPCADSYTIVNRAVGTKSTTKTPVTSNDAVVTVKVSPYAQFSAVKLDPDGNVYSEGIPFRLEQWLSGGWQLVASGTAQGGAITLEDAGGEPFRIHNPDGTERLRLIVEVPDNSYPPFTLVSGDYLRWTKASANPMDTEWYFDFDSLGDYFSRATAEGEDNKYCGIFTFTVYDLPDSSITVEKSGQGLTDSVFYLYPVDEQGKLGEPHTVNVDSAGRGSLSHLPFGTYRVFEITRSEYHPVESGASWIEATDLPPGVNVGVGYRIYQRENDLTLDAGGADITLTVSNRYLDHLIIEKEVPLGVHSERAQFTFTVVPTGGSTPLWFVPASPESPHQAVYRYVEAEDAGATQGLLIDFDGVSGTEATLKVIGLPKGSYEVRESAIADFNGVSVYDGHPADVTVVLGTSPDDGPVVVSARFVNKRRDSDASITIEKQATDDFGERFLFRVEGANVNLQDGVNFTVTPATPNSYAVLSADTFVMAAGHRAVISGLPHGNVYTVTEMGTESGDLSAYATKVTSGGLTGSRTSAELTAGNTAWDTALFKNGRQKHDGEILLKKLATLWPVGDRFAFTLYRYDYSSGSFVAVESPREIQSETSNTLRWTGLYLGVPYRIYETKSLGMTPTGDGWAYDDIPGQYYYEFTLTAVDQAVAELQVENQLTALTVTKKAEGNIPDSEIFRFQVQRESVPVSVVPSGSNSYLVAALATDQTGITDSMDIRPGETVTIYGLPKDEELTVVETVDGGYLSVVENGGKFQFDDSNRTRGITITNTNEAAILVTKLVEGDASERSFDFMLYQIPAIGDPVAVNLTVSGTDVTAHQGSGTGFSLKGGQTATITGLQKGTTYAVVEVATPHYTTLVTGDGVDRTIDGNPGRAITIASNPVTGGSITFTNTAEAPALYVAKQAAGETDGDVFQITVERLLNGGGVDNTWTPITISFSGISDGNHNFDTPVAVPGIEAGHRYRITEAANDSYEASGTLYRGVDDAGGTGSATSAGYTLGGEILLSAGDRARVDVTNKRRTDSTSLTVTKTVENGKWADGDRFSFLLYRLDATGAPVRVLPGGTVLALEGLNPASWQMDGTLLIGKDTPAVTFQGLDRGATYWVQEVGIPGDYTFASVTNPVSDDGYPHTGSATLSSTALTPAIDFVNTRLPGGEITVKKEVSGDYEGQVFSFTISPAISGTGTFTLKNGESKTFSGLDQGAVYTVTEEAQKSPLFQFVKAEMDDVDYTGATGVQITVPGAGETRTLTYHNERNTSGSIRLTKTVDGTWPAGRVFSFQLYRLDGEGVWQPHGNVETAEDGDSVILWQGLTEGSQYRIAELSVSGESFYPAGWDYDEDFGYYTQVMVANDKTVELTAVNTPTKLVITKKITDVNPTSFHGRTFLFQVWDENDVPLLFTGNGPYYASGSGSPDLTLTFGASGNEITVYGLPLGNGYRVVETEDLGLTPSYRVNGISGDGSFAFAWEKNPAAQVEVTNSNASTALTVTKKIGEGHMAGGTYTFSLYHENGTIVKLTDQGGNSWTAEGGDKDTFTIDAASGTPGSVTIYGLVPGATYYVEETDTTHGGDAYRTEYLPATVTLNPTGEIVVTNTPLVSLTVEVTADNALDDIFLVEVYEGGENGTLIETLLFSDRSGGYIPLGDSHTIDGLKAGVEYYVVEKAGDGTVLESYTTTVREKLYPGDIYGPFSEARHTALSMEPDQDGWIHFHNTRDGVDGALTVTKILGPGTTANPDQVFTITVSGTFVDGAGKQVFRFGASGDYQLGEVADVAGVLPGLTYQVEETGITNGELEHYQVTISGVEENPRNITVPANSTAHAEVKNTAIRDGKISFEKQVAGGYWEDGDTFTFQLTDSHDTPVVNYPGMTANGAIATDQNGMFTLTKSAPQVEFSGLELGVTYRITEQTPDSRYTMPQSPQVDITATSRGGNGSLINSRTADGSASLVKEVEGLRDSADGFRFVLEARTPDGGWETVSLTAEQVTPESAWHRGQIMITNFHFAEGSGKSDPIGVDGLYRDWEYRFREVDLDTGRYRTNAGEGLSFMAGNTDPSVVITAVNTRLTGEVSLVKTASHDVLWPEEGFRFQLRHRDETGVWSLWGDSAERFLQPGVAQVWGDLPAGETFRLYEVDPGLYRLSSGDGWTAEGDDFYREFTARANETLHIDAHNTLTELSVSKVVVTGAGDETFRFQVQQGRKPLTFRQAENRENLYFYDAAGDLLSLPIRDGETVTLLGLPLGIYQVLETETGGYIPGYPLGDTVAFTEGEMAGAVTIANGQAPTRLTLRKTVTNRNTAIAFSAVVREQLADGSAGRYLRFQDGVFQGYTDAQSDAVIRLQPEATVTLTGLPLGSYLVQEVDIPDDYTLWGIDQPIFRLTGTGDDAEWHAHAQITNRYTSGGGGSGGGGGGSGGGRDIPDSVTFSGSSGNPTVSLDDGGIPLIDIEDGDIPQAGGLPIELALVLGAVLLVTGALLKRRQAKENDVK